MEYLPNQIQTLYSESFLKELFKKKLTKFGVPFLAIVAARLYTIRQSKIVKKVKRDFESLKTATTYNCTVKKLKEKQDQLLEAAEKIKSMI